MKKLIYLLTILILTSCATGFNMSYQVSTNTDPFKTISKTTYDLKLSEDNGQNQIVEKKMLKMVDDAMIGKGWIRNASNPDYLVSLSYSISDGTTSTRTGSVPQRTSHYNYQTQKTTYTTTQKQYSKTSTTFERTISVYLHSSGGDLVWQGDLISHGTTQDVMFVAPHLIPQAIRYIGETDLSEKYSHSCKNQGCPESIRK